MLFGCEYDIMKDHPLTGNSQTFIQEGFSTDHEAMGSKENTNCTSCGLHISSTVNTYVVSWLRGFMCKSGFGPDKEKTVMEPNYGMLAEKLLYPHGEQVGMCKPFYHKSGEDLSLIHI